MQESYIIRIKPSDSLASFDWRHLWRCRQLFYMLVWRDLKVRYKQTLFGVLWAILQPVLTTFIFTIVFTGVSDNEKQEIPYWLFALSGFVFWTFFSSSVGFASASLLSQKDLITKIFFPRMIIPAAAVGAYFFDLLLTLLILFGGMVYYQTVLTWKIIFVPVFLIFFLILTNSVSLLLAALNVRFRDVKFIIPFLLQIWLFISPIFYRSDWIPEKWRSVFALNPITGCVDGFRSVLFGTKLDAANLIISVCVTVALFFAAIIVFRRMEDDFGELL